MAGPDRLPPAARRFVATVVIGLIFVPETKDRDIYAHD